MTEATYHMRERDRYYYEMGPFRPPSEGQSRSLLIRASRGCSWNRCTFCISTNRPRQKFEYRPLEELKSDIDTIKAIVEEIDTASHRLGHGGRITNEVINAMIRGTPEVYSSSVGIIEAQQRLQCIINIANWLDSGARTVFLQDSNSLILRTPDLVGLLKYLKQTFPTIERVTTYGRAKTCYKKSLPELQELHEAGLSRIHVGFETGCDEVLDLVDKGVTAEEEIIGGRRVVEAGISLSEYFMPGLGGQKWSDKHALDSAHVLSEVNADFIRLRTLALRRDSPLYEKYQQGGFTMVTESGMVDEIGLLIENLDCDSHLASDHVWNLLMEVEGKLPEDKEAMLATIRAYQSKPPMEKLEFTLNRRLNYWGAGGDLTLGRLVEEARAAISNESPDAEERVEKATFALKQHGG